MGLIKLAADQSDLGYRAMATSSAWVSVVVKSCSGQQVYFPRSIVKCSWDDRFGSLLMKVGGHDMEGRTIAKIVIAKTEKFTDPTPPDAPIVLCEQFNCFRACLYVEESSHSMETESVYTERNSFDVLMAATCERVLPKAIEPPEGKDLRSDQRLYNDILGMTTHTRTHTHTHTHTLRGSV